MGRKYYQPKKVRRSNASLLATIAAALFGGRHHGPYTRRPSLKRSLIGFVLNRLARRFH